MKKQKVFLVLTLFAIFLSLVVHAGAADWRTQKLDAVFRDIKIFLFGEEITPTDANGKVVEPFIVDGTTYVPLRAIGEAFGLNVDWDGDASAINLSAPHSMYYPEPPPAPSKNVEVSTAAELVKAIAPDTCITLKAGKYDVSTVAWEGSAYVSWKNDRYNMGEHTLVITGVEGLVLQAAPGADVEIVTPWRFAKVLEFSNCNGVRLSGIKAGHSITGDYDCDEGVVCFKDSCNIAVEGCTLYGSGAIGLEFDFCVSAAVTDTTVTDCSRLAVDVRESSNMTFYKCKFVDNRTYDGVIAGSNSSAVFMYCEISGNRSLEYGGVVSFSNALFERCVFLDNAHIHDYIDGSGAAISGMGLQLLDCEIEKGNFGEYWSAGIINLGGNVLS